MKLKFLYGEEKGFTLAELIISVTIISVLLTFFGFGTYLLIADDVHRNTNVNVLNFKEDLVKEERRNITNSIAVTENELTLLFNNNEKISYIKKDNKILKYVNGLYEKDFTVSEHGGFDLDSRTIKWIWIEEDVLLKVNDDITIIDHL